MVWLRFFKSINCSDEVLVLFAESPVFEGSILECDNNLFRNVRYCKCNATVFSNHTSDKKIIASIIRSLSLNANTSDPTWCQLIVLDSWFNFRD